MKKALFLPLLAIFAVSCGNDSSTGPTPTTTTTSVMPDPRITDTGVQINRTQGNYHYVGWKFTIDSPRAYGYAYVEIHWYDSDNFQVEWSNWAGDLKQGVHTYSDETIIRRDIWQRIVRYDVELQSWR